MAASSIKLSRRLPLLLIDGVLFPGASIRIPVSSEKNMNMVKNHLLSRSTLNSTIIGAVPKERGCDSEDEANMLHSIGTAGIVVQVTGTNWSRPSYTLLVTGLCRFKLEKLIEESPYLVGSVCQLDKLPGEEAESDENNAELNDLMEQFREQATKLIDMLDLSIPAVVRLKRLLNSLPIQSLPDICAAIVRASHDERLQILDAVDLADRFRKTLPLLVRQIEGYNILQKARKDLGGSRPLDLTKFQPMGRRLYDDMSEKTDEISALEKKAKEMDMPDHARKVALREIQKLKKMPPHMPDHAVSRNYVELLLDLPWSKESTEIMDLNKSRADLDADHYGMSKLKKRVLEYLSVRQLKNTLKGPILCFVGPPGVGKTSVGRSIARSLGREFHRISLGGVCDQADIRGHRRTYIGSMPGRIIQGLRAVGVKNPVFLLDEIDKMSTGIHGDPAAALLEVLDPEQNSNFTDHYLNVPFDLSQVLFIATANTTTTIPPALYDRMEVISVPGYTHDEKEHIAVNHLVPKQLKEHGLTPEMLVITPEAVQTIIHKYTKEAGVRSLERKIGALCRAVAVKVVEKQVILPAAREAAVDVREVSGLKTKTSPEEESLVLVNNITHPPELPFVLGEEAVMDILGSASFSEGGANAELRNLHFTPEQIDTPHWRPQWTRENYKFLLQDMFQILKPQVKPIEKTEATDPVRTKIVQVMGRFRSMAPPKDPVEPAEQKYVDPHKELKYRTKRPGQNIIGVAIPVPAHAELRAEIRAYMDSIRLAAKREAEAQAKVVHRPLLPKKPKADIQSIKLPPPPPPPPPPSLQSNLVRRPPSPKPKFSKVTCGQITGISTRPGTRLIRYCVPLSAQKFGTPASRLAICDELPQSESGATNRPSTLKVDPNGQIKMPSERDVESNAPVKSESEQKLEHLLKFKPTQKREELLAEVCKRRWNPKWRI